MSKIKRMKAKQTHERKVLKKQQEIAELERLREEGEEEENPPEEIQKDYGYDPYLNVGPTSFQELEELESAREIAHEVNEVTWNVQDLVRNILYHPLMDPKEKSTKIQQVASEFEERVSDAMEGVKKDMDVLQIEAILATDARNTNFLEKGVSLVKEVLSSQGRKNLDDSDFALVYEKDGKKVRKYPLNDKAHVRNALARAAQQIKAGGEGAEDARKALPKIRAAAKKFGIETSVEKSAILIEKDAKGDWRWIGRPTNNFIDWQEDIISKSAHQKYVAWLDENPELAPVFLTWHTPGTAREHPVDFWMEQDGAVIMSGILTENEAASLFEMQKEVDLGMSHQALAMRLDPKDRRVVTDYWMYEVSDLPLDKAANPFVTLETMTKEVGMDKLEYLTKIMGSKEKAEAYLQKTSQTQKDLQEAGITSKAKEEEQTAQPTQVTTPEAKPALDVTALFKQIAEEMKKEFDIEGLNAFVAQAQEDHAKVGVLEELVKELSTSTDEQLAKALTPPAARYAWSQDKRASQSDTTKLKKDDSKDEKLSKEAPGVPANYWLSEVTGTVPISETS